MYALEKVGLFNLLCIPPDGSPAGDTSIAVYTDAIAYCVLRRAMLLVDPPAAWNTKNGFVTLLENPDQLLTTDLALSGLAMRNAALYFQRVTEPDPAIGDGLSTFVPCGAVAGVIAQTDATRGVWKAPAGLDAGLNGVQGFAVSLGNDDNGALNPVGINCLRSFPVAGNVVWGARTLRGAD